MGLNPYKSVNGYTVVYNHGAIKIITKDKLDVMDWVVFLPKSLIQFILEFDLPSPLKASVLSLNEEVGCDIDSLCYSPDEKRGFLLCKNMYYITK